MTHREMVKKLRDICGVEITQRQISRIKNRTGSRKDEQVTMDDGSKVPLHKAIKIIDGRFPNTVKKKTKTDELRERLEAKKDNASS